MDLYKFLTDLKISNMQLSMHAYFDEILGHFGMLSQLGGFDFSRKGFSGLFAMYKSLEDQRVSLYKQVMDESIAMPDRNAPDIMKEIE